ncbi:isocitrate lyase/phosphoenolpyruvate mutase family protein [Cognatishimia sp. MH4019]|uniref:isocitrate lyase/PEP mutase family protein n=1 Tax=Cognatishimia sp. MH4019 TaxID=2854030 RepID=UPI001CD3FCFF|nr:isocitrate lyase/phosphoenolpyruvate mutase family protein [Cognatishimia sp. MH4019]
MTSFRDLHQPGNPFILANAWDIGSAKMLVAMGAQAIGTSSAAHGFTLGVPDANVPRDQALAHAQDLVAAVNVPVSGDFENGYGDDPDICAETVRLSAEAGLAGICIEDTALPGSDPYDVALASERMRAAASAAKALGKDFFLVGRTDVLLLETEPLDRAIARLQAFEAAGVDGLYAPGVKSLEDLKAIVDATSLPVNALAIAPFQSVPLSALAKTGIARVSLGSALARATQRTLHDAAKAMLEDGDFSLLAHGISGDTVDKMLS